MSWIRWIVPVALASAEGGPRELPDGSGVVLLEVARMEQWRGRRGDGMRREREHLEAGAVESDEILGDDPVAHVDVVVEVELEGGADSVLGVEADAVAVSGEDEEEVERALGVSEGDEEAAVEESVG